MNVIARVWGSLKALGCMGRHRFWDRQDGACFCGRISRVVLHPIDWQSITLTRAVAGQYTWGRSHEPD